MSGAHRPWPGPNFVPLRYRGVAVTTVPPDVALDEPSLRAHLVGRQAYRRTRFVVARRDPHVAGPTALVRVERRDPGPLFSEVTAVEMLAGSAECTWVRAPEVDTGIPSALAAVARDRAPGSRAVVVEGRYSHVNFILDAQPLPVVVHEVVPPEPAKLADQARRVVAVSEDLRPVRILEHSEDLAELAARAPAGHYLLPCRGSGGEVPGATVSYLDEHPPRADWTLLGCARSLQIHRWFYGDEPPTVDFCPKRTVTRSRPERPTLTKCCLQEEDLDQGDGWVSVPWGSSLAHVREALALLTEREGGPWAAG